MGRGGRRAVRLLPVGSDHDCRRVAREEAAADRLGYQRRAVGQHLSLRNIWTCSRGDSSRIASEARCEVTLSRRGFLAGAAAGLVISFHVPTKVARAAPKPAAPPLPSPNAFLRIGNDDSVTVILAHSE